MCKVSAIQATIPGLETVSYMKNSYLLGTLKDEKKPFLLFPSFNFPYSIISLITLGIFTLHWSPACSTSPAVIHSTQPGASRNSTPVREFLFTRIQNGFTMVKCSLDQAYVPTLCTLHISLARPDPLPIVA